MTALLKKGDNAIGAQLAEGWWSGAITFQVQNWNYYGDRQSLLLKLVVTYNDGSQEIITSQPDEWKVLTDGALKLGSIYQGQTYDDIRAQELEGWDNVGFNDSAWTAAKVIPLTGTTAPGKWHEFLTDRDYENAAVNRLEQNVRWSAKANFFAISTDCPQRNERMGWSGDLAVFANTAVYLANSDNFLRQHMQALRDLQATDGRFTDTAPMGVGAGGFIWGSVGVIVQWELYLQYGDTATLAEHYDAMAAYMNYMAACQTPDGLLNEPKGLLGLGDWLSPQFGQGEAQPLWNAYEVNNLYIMMRTAEILGKSSDASKWRSRYNERKAHYAKRFFDAQGYALKSDGSRMDLQTAYAVPLALYNVVDSVKAKLLSQRLADTVKRADNVDDKGIKRPAYSLMTGFYRNGGDKSRA